MQSQRNRWIRSLAVAGMVLGFTGLVRAETYTWNGAAGSDWFAAANWTPAGPPSAGDAVIYTNAGTALLLTNETPALASFTMTDGTMTCTNWFTRIQATNVTIEGGTITLPQAFTEADMSNRVWIVASGDFMLGSNAVIDVNGKGYRAGTGPGTVVSAMVWGGAHGGRGGRGQNFDAVRAMPVGNRKAPLTPGSGGKAGNTSLGDGGGSVRIHVGGQAIVHGTIMANGNAGDSWNDGGGAGGAVYITCGDYDGNGLISVNGGHGGKWGGSDQRGGGGGGGRIAIEYDTVSGISAMRFSATAGASPSDSYSTVFAKGEHRDAWIHSAGQGTLFLPDAGLLKETLDGARFTDVELYMEGESSWSPSALQITNCRVTFAEEGFDLAVAGDLRVGADGELGVRGDVNVGGDAVLEDGGIVSLFAAPTNSLTPGYGSLLDVAGCLDIRDEGWLYPFSNPTNGGSVLLRMTDLKIASGGGIEASGKGFFDDHGDGSPASGWGGGAGYGGVGGEGQGGPGGLDYGVAMAPMKPGSGGRDSSSAANIGGMGGGLVWVEASGAITLNGAIAADSAMKAPRYNGGGGSGGGIHLWSLGRFVGGENAVLCADGGEGGTWSANDHRGGGGGGGRIAVWPGVTASQRQRILNGEGGGYIVQETHPNYGGTISVTNGIGRCDDADPTADPPLPGTVVFVIPPPAGTIFLLQ